MERCRTHIGADGTARAALVAASPALPPRAVAGSAGRPASAPGEPRSAELGPPLLNPAPRPPLTPWPTLRGKRGRLRLDDLAESGAARSRPTLG